MLALFMLPLAAVIYMIVFACLLEFVFSYTNEDAAFFISNLITAGFMVLYWSFLWKQSVQWTSRRIGLTLAAGVVSIIAGCILGLFVRFVEIRWESSWEVSARFCYGWSRPA